MTKPLSFQQISVEHLQCANHLNEHGETAMNKTIFALDRFGIWAERHVKNTTKTNKQNKNKRTSQLIVTRKIMLKSLKSLNRWYWLKNTAEALTNICLLDPLNYCIFSVLFVNHYWPLSTELPFKAIFRTSVDQRSCVPKQSIACSQTY